MCVILYVCPPGVTRTDPSSNIWEALTMSWSTLILQNINTSVCVCLLSAVWIQGEKHQEEKSQHHRVCRRRESQLEEKEKSEWLFFSFLFFYLNFERKDLRLGCMRCVLVSLQIKRLGSWSRRNQTNLLSSSFIWSGWIPSVVKLVRPMPTMNIMFLTSKFSETRFKFSVQLEKSFPASLLQLARLVEGLFKLHSEADPL